MLRSKSLLDAISKITKQRNEFSSMLSMVTSHTDEDSDSDSDSDASQREYKDDLSSEDEDDDKNPTSPDASLGDRVAAFWAWRRPNLVSSYAVAGWMLCPIAEIMEDAREGGMGQDRIVIEDLLTKLYGGELEENDDEIANLINTFWTEYDQFQLKEGPYN